MNPIRINATPQSNPVRTAKETRHMPFSFIRILDVGASILIVVLATVTAGATAVLGA